MADDDFVIRNETDLKNSNFCRITNHSPDFKSDAIQVVELESNNVLGEIRSILTNIKHAGNNQPVIFKKRYREPTKDSLQIKVACDFGPMLIDGLADGIWIENESDDIGSEQIYQLSLNLLQAARLRTSKTEYISCPSCGRTLFDLTSTIAKIREHTTHLKHLKIAIMGCIVNGPGEMADADYGYVGTGPGKITLYKSKQVMKQNILEENAVDELIGLIKENGDWIEP